MTQPLTPPPPQAFAYIVPLSLQCLLLHPAAAEASPRLAFVARLMLMTIGLYTSLTCTFDNGWQPRNASVGLNFVLGVGASYACWKTIEWGTVMDLTPYTWVGFKDDNDSGKAVKPLKTRDELKAIRKKQAEHDSLTDILVWTASLLLSMRGIGWAFGPSEKSIAPHGPKHQGQLVKQLVIAIVKRQAIFASMSAILLTPSVERATHLVRFGFSNQSASIASEAVGTLAFGTAACCALEMGFSLAILLSCIATAILRTILPDNVRPQPFDIRQYPPIFQQPWHPDNVSIFWSCQWHSFFSRSFNYLGFKPVSSVVGAVAGKTLGRLAGVTAVFGLSSWLHEYALNSASHNAINLSTSQLDFVTRWGSTIYFMSQGVGVVLESLYMSLSGGHKLKGVFGTIWAYCFTVGLGYLVYSNWGTRGLFQNLPHPKDWSWERWVIPLATIYPRSAFVQR
ncbi:hypothetical protein OIO90_003772 [Microbotryomycetes sp. JL221]|nr:hypothetical protein OIO90_003772 [Microbotryomycetes sp. JL221]